ncbi:hypothetical protein BC941DRAFT_474253 [Chlamydoabsidia padenii]|nr:hypothetical protein BC941DRAFT_474253 [Chlamydoabsidia padenii]
MCKRRLPQLQSPLLTYKHQRTGNYDVFTCATYVLMVVTSFRGLEQKVSSVTKFNLHLLTTGIFKVDYYWAHTNHHPVSLAQVAYSFFLDKKVTYRIETEGNHYMDWKVVTINDVIVAKCSVFGQRMVFKQERDETLTNIGTAK